MQTSPPRTRCSIATWLVVAALACAALVGCGADKTDQGPDGLAALDGGTGGDIVNPAAVDASVGLGDAGPPKPPMDPPAGAGFTCEVKTLLATKCQVCHTDPPHGGAVVPRLTGAHMFEWS